MKSYNVLYLEDNKFYRNSIISSIIKPTISGKIDAVESYEKAIEKITVNKYNLAILDIEIGERKGYELVPELRKAFPDIKIMLLSLYNNIEYIKVFYDYNIDAYLTKEISKDIFKDAILSLQQDEKYIVPQVAKVWGEYSSRSKEIENVGLSNREMEVIKKLCEDQTENQIAATLFVELATVKKHISNILKKIGARSRVGIFKFAVKYGIYPKKKH